MHACTWSRLPSSWLKSPLRTGSTDVERSFSPSLRVSAAPALRMGRLLCPDLLRLELHTGMSDWQ